MGIEKSNSLITFFTWIRTQSQAGLESTSKKWENLKERVQDSVDGLFITLASYNKLFEPLVPLWTRIQLNDDEEFSDEELENSIEFSDDPDAEEIIFK